MGGALLSEGQQAELLPASKIVDPGSRLTSIHEVKVGQYIWVLPSARLFGPDDQKGYLALIAKKDEKRNQVQVQLMNTKASKRRTGWQLVWAENGDWEGKERWTPVTHKYKPNFKPWIETVEFEDLIPAHIRVTGGNTNAKGKPVPYSINKPFFDQYLDREEPRTWAEHLRMLESKKDDPPPRAGVQARKREGNSSVNAILGSHGDREELRLILSVRELLKQSAGRFTRHPDPESVYDPFLPGTEQGGHVMGSRPRASRTRGQPHPERVGGPRADPRKGPRGGRGGAGARGLRGRGRRGRGPAEAERLSGLQRNSGPCTWFHV